ncbi:MAG: hypothetical protein EBV06_02895 [Planctomycetia bacterium]|nr:hypothetical protein [Planctomycetia bacterium]
MWCLAAYALTGVSGLVQAEDKPKEKPQGDKKPGIVLILGAENPDAAKIQEEIARKAKEIEELKRKLGETVRKPKEGEGSKPGAGEKPRGPLSGGVSIIVDLAGVGENKEVVEGLVKKIRELVGEKRGVSVRVAPMAGPKPMVIEGARLQLQLKGEEGKPNPIRKPGEGPKPEAVKKPDEGPKPGFVVKPGGPMPPPGGDNRRLADIERRLDELTRRLEDMMRRDAPRPGGPGGPGGPPRLRDRGPGDRPPSNR